MLDTTNEVPISLSEAGRLLGKHTATVYRWSTAGVRGVVLETIQVGGTRCTSREGVQRFCEGLTAARTWQPRSSGRAGIGAARAGEELERHGI
jgi:hypothetical protein